MGRSNDTRNPEPFELIGTTDLRESFKDGQHVRGSFSLNGVEMHQFDAISPAGVVSAINAKTDQHYLTAEIDDGGHLVLVDRSGAEPVVRMGPAWQDPPPASSGDAVRDLIAAQQYLHDQDKDEDRGNVLELLGLADAGSDRDQDGNVEPGFETGLSAEERQERYKAERWMRDAQYTPQGTVIYPNRPASGPAAAPGSGMKLPPGQGVPSNPSPGATGSQGDMPSGERRTGTGGGSGETAAATIQKTSTDRSAPAPAQ